MTVETARRRIRILRMGLTSLAAIYDRERSVRRMAGHAWYVATRKGLIGLREWLVQYVPPDPPVLTPVPSKPALPEPDRTPARVIDTRSLYEAWLGRYDPLQDIEVAAARRHLATLSLPDLLIVAVATPGTRAAVGRMVTSWCRSIHPGWHAVIVASAGMAATDMIHDEPRVSVVSTAAEVAAARAGCGHTLLCFGAVMLNSLTAYMMLEAAVRTGADIVYSDHDRLDAAGRRVDPAFKPQFSPEYLARYNYIGDCLLLAPSVPLDLAMAGSLPDLTRAGYDRLVARLVLGRRVEHLPFTLFHVQDATPHELHDLPVIADGGPGVAVIIPTRDGLAHLRPCIESILDRTSYDLEQVDIVVVDNNSVEPETLEYLDELASRPRFTVVRYPHPFNFAEINNVGARAATRDILVFLNNDTTVHDPAWLSKLVWYARQPGVGMVGGKLLFPDGTIQHGGCVAGSSKGTVQHLLSYARPDDVAATDHTREMSVLTGACVAVRRDVFDRVGGFDPILRITWNDVKTCLECLQSGLRNIYVADSLLIHDESKTRGQDDTLERYVRYFSEANYTRRRFRDDFYDDPSYNPNLSLDNAGDLAEPPRVRRPWFRPAGDPARILLLSTVYCAGFGVPVVIYQQAMKLRQCGYDVILGGPFRENEIDFPGCERVILNSVQEAGAYAFSHGVALIVSHTPPFFELPIWIGAHIPVLAYDYGEPKAEFFEEPNRSFLMEVGRQKRAVAALTTTIATISQAVKDETLNKDAIVLGLANSHLPAWSEAFRPDRDRVRGEHGWAGRFVVLTVCRFYYHERAYKGLDVIASILGEIPYLYPDQSKPLVWVLAGAGTPDDVEQAERLGFTVFANVSDAMLADLYKAADAYTSFSKWEGYNLGIAQALAMGLPTLGSDIAAHREFPIETTSSVLKACAWLAEEVGRGTAATPERRATVYDWNDSTDAVLRVIGDMLQASAVQKPRQGASGRVWEDAAT